MKKIILILFVFVILTGCDKIKPSEEIESMTDKFLAALKEAEIEWNDDDLVLAGGEIVGAKTGYKLTISGEAIYIYEYDTTSQDETTQQFLSEIRANGEITLFDIATKALYNKGLVLSNYENHSMKEKIIEVFDSLSAED